MHRRHQILIVEDNNADVFLIREAIQLAGVDADLHVVRDGRAATNFLDAADAAEAAPSPDLVLLDLNLPKKNGDEVLRHLRNSPRCRRAQVLVVTSSDAPRERETLSALGANGYFRKPSEYAQFLALGTMVRALLQRLATD